MEMTRRQFALSIAAAGSMRSSLFDRRFPMGCSPRRDSRPSHLGAQSGGSDLGWGRFLVEGRQQQPG